MSGLAWGRFSSGMESCCPFSSNRTPWEELGLYSGLGTKSFLHLRRTRDKNSVFERKEPSKFRRNAIWSSAGRCIRSTSTWRRRGLQEMRSNRLPSTNSWSSQPSISEIAGPQYWTLQAADRMRTNAPGSSATSKSLHRFLFVNS